MPRLSVEAEPKRRRQLRGNGPALSRPSRNQKGSAQDSQQPRSYGLILADPPIHGRPNLPADAGASEENPMGSSLLRHADHGTRHPDAPANSWHFLSRVRLSGTKIG